LTARRLAAVFEMFLVALFIVAAGITIVQVVANPLISRLGPPATVSSRLTFAQAFNSLGTTVFPYVGSALILGSLATIDPKTLTGAALQSYRAQATHVIGATYVGLALTLLVLAIMVWSYRNHLSEQRIPGSSWREALGLLRVPRFIFGASCIFLYVGAEVAIGSLIVNYLMQTDVLGLGQQAAGEHVPLYWGGAMVGRFIGSGLLQKMKTGRLLAICAVCAAALVMVSMLSTGHFAMWSIILVGFFNSIMFPSIFTLGVAELGPLTGDGSGIMIMAIVGGALIPLAQGAIADRIGIHHAFFLPVICYLYILYFALSGSKPNSERHART